MFTEDFYPTPRWLARKMVAKISPDAEYWMEPSAGYVGQYIAKRIHPVYATWERGTKQ